MKINANSLKQGNIINYNNRLWIIIKQPQHTMPGKGGAFVQVEMKDVVLGTKTNERFRSNQDVEKVRLDEQKLQFLFKDNEFLVFMDPITYEQVNLELKLFGDKEKLIKDNMEITVELYEGKAINVELPEFIDFEVIEAEPVIKGQTATSSYKPALLENNIRVMVPPFISTGTKIIIRSSDLTYIERVK